MKISWVRVLAYSLTMFLLLALVLVDVFNLRLLRGIAARPVVQTIYEGESNTDHAEQRADNQVTIMFNYE